MRILRALPGAAALAALLLLAAPGASAQGTACDPTVLRPGGIDLKDLSRGFDGWSVPSATTVVYFSVCRSTNCVTRTIYNQPIKILIPRFGCDELPELEATLDGFYFSVRRMNNPYPNLDPATEPNPRIGYEYMKGNILSPTGAVPIGVFEGNGVIATNTCRRPLPDGIGHCYDCWHHEGYLTMKFTSGPLAGRSAVFAEYHFHTGEGPGPYCDDEDPCKLDFQFFGALDGIFLSRCPVSTPAPNLAK